jgi:hypothetical protein
MVAEEDTALPASNRSALAMPNGMDENLMVLAFFSHAGGLSVKNAGVWDRAPGDLALPGGALRAQGLAKNHE